MAVTLFIGVFLFIAFYSGIRRLRQSHSRGSAQLPHPVTSTTPFPAAETQSQSLPLLLKHDVFLSFEETDVGKGFISHLYKGLTDNGIDTIRDDTQRRNFIERSRFAVVVVSENYANSRRCLQELVHITECAEKKQIELVPVFFGVDPSHLKRQSWNSEDAFAKHETRPDAETVKTWKTAMKKVGLISGWDSRNWKEESKLIKELVQDLSDRLLSPVSSNDDSGELIGMSTHMRSIYPLIRTDLKDVRMIGICGIHGIGKTAIAKFVYKGLLSEFYGVCFVENVKGDFMQYSPSHLRKKILTEIYRNKNMNICKGDSVMKQRLCGKKVLLVLDDVDDINQLEELAGSSEWFGPGSRIIITTRDRRVLEQHDVEHVYEVDPLTTNQALELFSKHAFKQPCPHEGFRELSLDVIEQLDGLPLALKRVGASLYRRELEFWEEELVKLRGTQSKGAGKGR